MSSETFSFLLGFIAGAFIILLFVLWFLSYLKRNNFIKADATEKLRRLFEEN